MRQENNLRLGMTWEWHENGNAKASANGNGNENGNGMEETNTNANTNVNRDALKSNGKWNWSFLPRCCSPSSPTSPAFSTSPASSSSPASPSSCCLLCLLRWQRQHKCATSSNALSLLGAKLLYGGARPTCSCCQWNTVQCVHLWQPPWYRNAAPPSPALPCPLKNCCN